VSGYTLKNLKQIDDAAVRYGLSPQMESRFARDDLESEQLGLSYQRLGPGARQPFSHRHEHDEELYVVLSGTGWVQLEGEVVGLLPLDALRVAPSTVRAFAAGPTGMELIAFGPFGVGDAEALPVDWDDTLPE
jgi:quercetin dioxygenase-like cupin family protein